MDEFPAVLQDCLAGLCAMAVLVGIPPGEEGAVQVFFSPRINGTSERPSPVCSGNCLQPVISRRVGKRAIVIIGSANFMVGMGIGTVRTAGPSRIELSGEANTLRVLSRHQGHTRRGTDVA